MIILEPRTVFVMGMSCAGKSTTCNLIAQEIANSFPLRRNDMIWGMMHVAPTKTSELPPFEDYVKKDTVFPEHAREVETPFGVMTQVLPLNAFYDRHASRQSYLLLARAAAAGLAVHKMPILDRFLGKHVESGTLQKFISSRFFDGYPRYLLHFIADAEVCYKRFLARKSGENEWDAARRNRVVSWEKFRDEFAERERARKGLELIPHLTIDTTTKTPEECAKECISYISG